jgi:hypothetical protein
MPAVIVLPGDEKVVTSFLSLFSFNGGYKQTEGGTRPPFFFPE